MALGSMVRVISAPYAERSSPMPGPFDLRAIAAWGTVSARLPGRLGVAGHAQRVGTLAAALAGRSDAALLAEAAAVRPALLDRPAAMQPRVFALVHAAVERHLGLRYHPVQLAGGRALTRRRVVEMATGEGKTITAALPAAAAALAGQAVHIVTVNDYLARRDAERLRPVYGALGLTVGLVQEGDEPAQRRQAYAADVTYVTNKELTFDYLKDRIAVADAPGGARHALAAAFGGARDGLLLRGLQVALVDEADSVLIDEARTPLIISAERANEDLAGIVGHALDVARGLRAGEDFHLDEAHRAVRLTANGQAAVATRLTGGSGLFRARYAREQVMTQALTALHVFVRDQDYIVADGKVQIVDEYTGRIMPDRSWEQGLHQLVEAKEALALTGTRQTIARITYQRFFNRYLLLSGMTGTAREVAGELRSVYGLGFVRLRTHRPPQRKDLGGRLLPDAAAKWDAVAARAAELAGTGRPVLVGTATVDASEALGAVLARSGLPHVVLNARQDAEEADIVAQAGQPGRVTVATNMAGRGTDIELTEASRRAGGLHVILTEFSDSRRIDRQLYGRAGRQGDPGSFESYVAVDDQLFTRFAGLLLRVLAGRLPGGVGRKLLQARAQAAASRSNAQQRRAQVLADEQTERQMGFARRE